MLQLKGRRLSLVLLSLVLIAPLFSSTVYGANSWQGVVNDVEARINEALDLYANGNVEAARQSVTDAYFGPFEGEEMEQAVQRNIGSQNASKVEYMFTELKQLMKQGASTEEVKKMADKLLAELNTYAVTLDEIAPKENKSPIAQFLYSLLIIVREGFEAILIISAITAYLVKSGHLRQVKTVLTSTILAIAASVLTAILFKFIFHISGAGQEILEGVTMLLATAVLFSVSFWLISKVEAKKWEQYIKGKVKDSLTTGSSFALWSAVFLAVYREGAETVLFYQALLADADKSSYGMIGLGFLVGCLLLAILYLIIREGSMRIPLKPFFLATSVLLYYMAFVFAGEGVRELQEAGIIGTGQLDSLPTISWLGIYPTWQSAGLQALLLLTAVVGIGYHFLGNKRSPGRSP